MASPSPKIQINVIFQKQTVTFSTKREKPFLKMFDAFATRMNMEPQSLRFYLNEMRIRPEQTPAELNMDDGDEIDATLMQQGGYHPNTLCSDPQTNFAH